MPGCIRALVVLLALCASSAAAGAQTPIPTPQFLEQSAVQTQLEALPVESGGLFTSAAPAQAGSGERPQAAGPARARRTRWADIDPAYLRRLLGAERLSLTADGRVDGRPPQFVLNLFDDTAARIVLLDSHVDTLGMTVIRGTVVGGGSAILVIDNGRVTAQINTGERTFAIRPAADGTHRVVELDPAAPQNTDDARRPPITGERKASNATQMAQDLERPSAATTLTLLFAYTPASYSAVASLKSVLSLNVAYLNTAFQNSQIDVDVQIVGVEQVNYTEAASAGLDDILNDLSNGVGDFARINQIRAAVRADVMSVIARVSSEDSCGVGWINDDFDEISNLASATKYGANVVLDSCTDDGDTFAHEMGHNLGANHDRYVVSSPAAGTYNYGYVDIPNRFRDIMAYSNQCTAAGVSCTRLQYFSNPSVTYNGAPLGVAVGQANAADASRRIREIAPYVAQLSDVLGSPTSLWVTVLVSGTGTVTSSPAGISCGVTCSSTFTAAQTVTLTPTAPAGWRFKEWSGACTGSGACTVTVTQTRNVTATFTPTTTFGPLFSSINTGSKSYVRVANTGSSAGTVTVKLADYATGSDVHTWTSPSIVAGGAAQYPIDTIETGMSGTKPLYYAARVETSLTGYTQHVLFKPADGTLTNLSMCDANVTARTGQVSAVHSSVVGGFGYPSTIAIVNRDSSSASAQIGIYDPATGTKLGTYTSASIPSKGQVVVPITTIETGASVTPIGTRPHYTLKIDNTFTGFLQHLMSNDQVAVIADMTPVCDFTTVAEPPSTVSLLQSGPIYSTAQSGLRSYVRVFNTGGTAGTVAVTLRNYSTGAKLGQWVSPSIPAGSSQQFPIADIESVVSGTKPDYYSAQIETQVDGYYAHVLWKPADGTLTNLSTCGAGIRADGQKLFAVHSSIVGAVGFPSTVTITNTGGSASAVTLGIYRSSDNVKIGTYVSPIVPAGGQVLVTANAIEAGAGITPSSDALHYIVRIESSFTGFLQHLLDNQRTNVLTDMTTVCKLPAVSISYQDCGANSGTTCTVTVGGSVTGQVKQDEGNHQPRYQVSLTAGQAYTIDVKGASTSNGTLTRPYVYITGPSPSTSVAKQGGGGGTGDDARISFTPTTTGTYSVLVTSYVYANNAGTFVLSVQ